MMLNNKSFLYGSICLLLCAMPASACARRATPTVAPTPTPAIVGYLPDYRPLDPEWGRYLTDVIYFSAEPSPSGELDTGRLSKQTLAALNDMHTTYGTRIWVALGGWGRSRHFATVALDAALREQFAQNLLHYCLDNHLAGVDLDWEFPQNDQENRAYVELLAAIHRAFAPHGLRVSVALAGWQDLGAELYQVVDRIHVMSYDHPGRHATFENAVADIEAWLARGAPPEKLLLGVPFYGRQIDNPDVATSYMQIVSRYHPAPETDEVEGIYFNGIATIRQKTRYAQEQRLGGIMIWELGQDTRDETSLLRAIHASLYGQGEP